MTTCSCHRFPSKLPLGSIGNPFPVLPGTSWSVRLWFWRVGSQVLVTGEDECEPNDAEPIRLDVPARTGAASLRPTSDHVGTPITALTVTIDTPQTGQRRGRVTVTMPATSSVFPQITPRSYVFDVRLVADDDPTDVLGSPLLHVNVLEGSTR